MPSQKPCAELSHLHKLIMKNYLHYNDDYYKNLPTNDAAFPVGAHMRIFGFVKSSPSFAKMFIALYDIALIVKDFPFPNIKL